MSLEHNTLGNLDTKSHGSLKKTVANAAALALLNISADDLAQQIVIRQLDTNQNWVPTSTGVGATFKQSNADVASQINNDSTVTGSKVKDALNTLKASIAALVTGVSSVFGRSGPVTAQAGDYTATQINAAASGVLLGRFAAGAGAVQEGALGGGLEVNAGLTAPQIASTLPARGTENVGFDLWPSSTPQGAIANSTSITLDVPLTAGKQYTRACRVWVGTGGGGAAAAVSYMKEVRVICYVNGGAAVLAGGTAGVIVTAAPFEGLGWSFTVTVNGLNIRYTLTNASGAAGTYNIAEVGWFMDLP